MKIRYLELLILITSIVGFCNCASDDDHLTDIILLSNVPVLFSLNLDSEANDIEVDMRNLSEVIDPSENDSMMKVSMVEKTNWASQHISQLRTSWGSTNNLVTWTTGDQIGIYMRLASGVPNTFIDQSNVQYAVTQGSVASSLLSSSAPLYFPVELSNFVNFFLYYPYSWVSTPRTISTSSIVFPDSASMNSTTLNYTLPADQSTQQALRDADIMCASVTSVNKSSPNVELNFNHKMALITIQVRTSLLSSTVTRIGLSGLSITNTGTLNLTTSKLTPNTVTTFVPFATMSQTASTTVTATADFIINPCIISNNETSSRLQASITAGGITRMTNLTANATFVAGTRYIYTVTILL